MLLARLVGIDPLAQIAILFLILTVLITFGLGGWVIAHLMKKDSEKKANAK